VKRLLYFLLFFICTPSIKVSADDKLNEGLEIAGGVVGGLGLLGVGAYAYKKRLEANEQDANAQLIDKMYDLESYKTYYRTADNQNTLGEAVLRMADELGVEPKRLIELDPGDLYVPSAYFKKNEQSLSDWKSDWLQVKNNIEAITPEVWQNARINIRMHDATSYNDYINAENATSLDNAIKKITVEINSKPGNFKAKPIDVLNALETSPKKNPNLSTQDWEAVRNSIVEPSVKVALSDADTVQLGLGETPDSPTGTEEEEDLYTEGETPTTSISSYDADTQAPIADAADIQVISDVSTPQQSFGDL
jgi:hypothetical protein